MKEPNGTLVMTTCKCRENTKNLVMTRAYFEDIIRLKVEQERKRVIEILEGQLSCSCSTPVSHAIALIKGETE